MKRPANFMAQDAYLVAQANWFSDQLQQVAIALYQPLVGPVALALYLTLWQEATPRPSMTERRPQTQLLEVLNISVDQLYDARVHLEAVGLLKTYTAIDAMGRYYAYELYAPLAADRFFADDLLGMLLYDRVGGHRYVELAERFTLQPVSRTDWQDDTHQFLDVYHLTSVTPPADLAPARAATQQKPTPQVSLGKPGVDWALVKTQAQGYGVSPEQITQQEAALGEIATFYGLDALSLSRLIGKAADVMTGKVAAASVRRLAEQTYQKKTPAFTDAPVTASAAPATGNTDWTPEEQALLQRVHGVAPRQFLEAVKQAKGPRMFVAGNETLALRNLANRGVFDDDTLNVLVDYVLRDRDSLNQAYLDSVANAWLKAGVNSPQSALLAIRDYQTKAANRKPRSRKPARQEQVPAWLKQRTTPTSPQQPAVSKAKLAEQMAKLKALQEKGGTQS